MTYLDWDATGKTLQRRKRYNLLDNVDSQASSNKPTTRSDGTALAVGDRWLSTNDRFWFYWNGSYWLSELILSANTGIASSSTAIGIGLCTVDPSFNLFLLSFRASGRINTTGTHDASNYWTFSASRVDSASESLEGSVSGSALVLGQRFQVTGTINAHRDVAALGTVGFQAVASLTGSPAGLVRPAFSLFYRLAKP